MSCYTGHTTILFIHEIKTFERHDINKGQDTFAGSRKKPSPDLHQITDRKLWREKQLMKIKSLFVRNCKKTSRGFLTALQLFIIGAPCFFLMCH